MRELEGGLQKRLRTRRRRPRAETLVDLVEYGLAATFVEAVFGSGVGGSDVASAGGRVGNGRSLAWPECWRR